MSDPKVKMKIDYKKCAPNKCKNGICVAILACPNKLIKQLEPYDFPYPIPGFCQECAKCREACLSGAIEI